MGDRFQKWEPSPIIVFSLQFSVFSFKINNCRYKCMRLLQSILSIAMTGNKDNGNDRKESPLTLSLRGERKGSLE